MSLRALYASATGMDALETRVGNIANNLSNINTVGYKASRENFEDLMYDQIVTPGAEAGGGRVVPVGIQVGHGTKLVGVYKHFSQGELSQTNRELDVAIEGNGFLEVTLDDGTSAFTRDGSMKLNENGELVTTSGYIIQPSMTIPQEASSVSIGKDGTITVSIPGESAPTNVGQIQLSIFQNPSGLKAIGQNLYQTTTASGSPSGLNPGEGGAGTLNQGFVENSNVNVSEELVSMIVAQRTYEANARVLSATSDMMRTSSGVGS